jgi:predicted DNA-binding WGR domain protein
MSIVKQNNKTIIYPIDPNCKYKDSILVENDIAYTCTLNQTDLESNKNKFYIMHVIPHGNIYSLFTRYGRLGDTGIITYKDGTQKKDAIYSFEKQFKAKTGNKWNSEFVHKEGKYFMSRIEYETTAEIKDITKLISDVEVMNKTLIELDVDPQKLPLGKISTDQMDKANDILTQISDIIKVDKLDDELVVSNLTKLCSKFYTLIPYITEGRKKPPIINNKDIVSTFTDLLDELKNLAVAVKIINNVKDQTDLHPCDAIYNQINTDIKPLDKTSDEWKYIMDYITNTQGPTHRFKIDVLDIYDIERKGEKDTFDKYCAANKIDNKTLLWHGSSITNFCSIFQKGLLLNPESLGVYISGKMFGSAATYFAACHSKSVGYCKTELSDNIGGMLLCEVMLGTPLKKLKADHYLSSKSMKQYGTHSTWAVGKTTASSGPMVGDLHIPNGKMVKSNENTVLLYDEYIVYNSNQVHQKYLVLFKKHNK